MVVCPFFVKFGIGVFPKTVYSKSDFTENQYTESRNLLRGVNTFLSTLSTFIARCVCEIRYKRSAHMALNHLQCHAGKDREGRALVKGINVTAVPRVRYSRITLW